MPLASHPILDELCAADLITAAQRDTAIVELNKRRHESEPFDSLGQAIVWLSKAGLFTDDDFEALARTRATDSAFATQDTRQRAIRELDALDAAAVRAGRREYREKVLAFLLPGPRWAWVLGAPCVALFAAWYHFAPDRTPGCDSADVKRGYTLAVHERQSKMALFLPGDHASRLGKLTDAKEVGYVEEERARGCIATFHLDDLHFAVAYTVEPNEDGTDFFVKGSDPRVVEARFGRAGQGESAGQPIGVATLRSIFTQAVADIEKRSLGSNGDSRRRNFLTRTGRESEFDLPTVRSVVPLGPCVQADPGQFSCRLQVRYSDLALGEFTEVDLQIFEGEFEFEQAAGQWKVAPNFEQKFADAKRRARTDAIEAEGAARSMQ